MICLGDLTMNKKILFFILLLSSCAPTVCPVTKPVVNKVISPLPEIQKPVLSKVTIGYENNHFTLDKNNISIMYKNYQDIIDYSLQEKNQLEYYKNMLKDD